MKKGAVLTAAILATLISGTALGAVNKTSSKKTKNRTKYRTQKRYRTKKISAPQKNYSLGLGYGINSEIKLSVGSNSTSTDKFSTANINFNYIFDTKTDIAYSLGATLINIDPNEGNEDIKNLRVEGNIRKNIEKATIYGGLNLGKYVSGEVLEDLGTGLGFQIGGTYNVYKDFLAVIQYSASQNSGEVTGHDSNGYKRSFDYDLTLSTLELGLKYRF